METYVSLIDSDEDDVTAKGPTVVIDSSSEGESSQTRPTRPRATRRGRSARTVRAAAKRGKKFGSVAEDSNSNHSTSSGGALKETQLRTQPETVLAIGDSVLTCPVSDDVAQLHRGDAENVHPTDTQSKTKPKIKKMSDSDTDSDFDGPVVKKPTKSRTIRRGLSKKKSISENENQINISSGESKIYSTRVSSCMDALRKGKLKLSADLVESDEDSDEVVALTQNHSSSQLTESADFSYTGLEYDYMPVETPEKNTSIVMIDRSPSPPPSLTLSLTDLRQPRLNNNVRNVIRIIQTAVPELQPSSQDQDLIFDGEDLPDCNREMMVKVRCRSGIQRFPLKMNEKFKKIVKEMAQHEGVQDNQIVLLRRGESIHLDECPQTINLHIADIIDCHIASEIGINDQSLTEDPDLITIYIQRQNLRSKTALKIRKDEKLQTLIQQYGVQLKQDVAKLTFQFDGDAITGDETADDLDMEDGDCIDAVDRQ